MTLFCSVNEQKDLRQTEVIYWCKTS